MSRPLHAVSFIAATCLNIASAGGTEKPPCAALKLPSTWDVRASTYADVTRDGTPECILSVWRPWKDWPIARWSNQPSPITRNRDAQNYSSHIAVLKPLGDTTFRNIWVGSALFQPVTDLAVLPDGTLLTLETTYQRGRQGRSVALSCWKWTGFGFGLLQREATELEHLPLLKPLEDPKARCRSANPPPSKTRAFQQGRP